MRMESVLTVFLAVLCFDCSKTSTTPRLGTVAVSVREVGSDIPVPGIQVDILQTNLTKTTDSTGVTAFQVDPGMYTVRVYNLQIGGPAVRNIDSTITVTPGQADTLKFFDCLMCF